MIFRFFLEMEDVEDHHSDSDESLAEVTQKSLLLTNALAQRAYEESPQSNGDNSSSELVRNGFKFSTGCVCFRSWKGESCVGD